MDALMCQLSYRQSHHFSMVRTHAISLRNSRITLLNRIVTLCRMDMLRGQKSNNRQA